MLKYMRLKDIKDPVAFFSAEYAIDNELPTYAGGLGILSGDMINEAANEHFPFVGIGILYKGKDYLQWIDNNGKARTKDSEFDHDTSFLRQATKNRKDLRFTIETNGQKIKVKSYYVFLSDTTMLIFLSTDVDGNPQEWVNDMDALYRGDSESQIRQQILLGVGGVRVLKELGITPRIYHINEGRPEFLIWEMAANLVEEKQLNFADAWQAAKETIVYTNHTLVAAGNMSHPENLVKKYASEFATRMDVNVNELIKDGVDSPGMFNTTLFALNISKKRNAVSKVHAEYAKREWPKFDWSYITNGIYTPRWQDSDFRSGDITDDELWNLHLLKKKELMKTVIQRTGFGYDTNKLVITWARRLAEYKQPKIIFSDLERLKRIISDPQRPVQILFAGNSHTADPNSSLIIEEIINLFTTHLSGHAIFVPNYNISLANHLTSGSDVWLNTPKGNLEACGTSGMKAISNGVLNCTVIDGWTNEVDWNGIGWVLNPDKVANSFYDLLETEIIPLYFERDTSEKPVKWIERMRRSIKLSENFTTEKMFTQYKEELYT